MSFQGPPGGSGIGPGVVPGAEVWRLPRCPPPYDLCRGMAYCAPQVGVGSVPLGSLETAQPEGEAGARVESNSEGASPDHCTARPRHHEAGQGETGADPEESQDIKALQKDLEQFAKLLKQKRITLGYTQTNVGLTWAHSLERCSAKGPPVNLRLCNSVSKNRCKLWPLLQMWVEETDNNKICRRYARQRS